MNYSNMNAQRLEVIRVKEYEHKLDDVMEIIDTAILKLKLTEVEQAFKIDSSELVEARLGIVYHEIALNLSFFSGGEHKGYATKSYEILHKLFTSGQVTALLPFVASYKASALALISAETRKLRLLGEAFREFDVAIDRYSSISYCPEFMRASVAENLPWFFFSKRKLAKRDLQSIIAKQSKNPDFANWKIMSFTYWAWANQHRGKRFRKQALNYLDLAINLDPEYKAGRKRAEELKSKMQN